MKAFIISQPKSGTYLCSNLLVEFGLQQTGLHLLNEDHYYHYDVSNPNAMHQRHYKSYIKKGKSLLENLKLIQENSFAVGHIQYSEKIKLHFFQMKLIYLSRNSDDRNESYKRMNKEFGRDIPSNSFLNKRINGISLWSQHAFNLTFEDMIDKNIEKINELQTYLFDELRYDSHKAIDAALLRPSITKSSIRK